MAVVKDSQELLSSAVAGDQSALVELLDSVDSSVRGKLTGKIPRRWQNLLSMDDLMQETYTDAFLDIEDYVPRGDSSFEAWIVTIAKNNLLNAIRNFEAEKRGGRRLRVDLAQSDESYVQLYELLGYSTTTPSRDAARREARSAIETAIERLPDDYRQVIHMYDIEGHCAAELSKAMNRSPGAVFMLRNRAQSALRKLMGSPLKYFSDYA